MSRDGFLIKKELSESKWIEMKEWKKNEDKKNLEKKKWMKESWKRIILKLLGYCEEKNQKGN